MDPGVVAGERGPILLSPVPTVVRMHNVGWKEEVKTKMWRRGATFMLVGLLGIAYAPLAAADEYQEAEANADVAVESEAMTLRTFDEDIEEVTGDEGVIHDVMRDGCLVTISVEVEGAGPFSLGVWDDNEEIDRVDWTEPGADEFVWEITQPAGEEAPGVDFVLLSADEELLDLVANWEYPTEVADECSAAVPVELSLVDSSGPLHPGETLHFAGSGFLGEEEVLVFILDEGDHATEGYVDDEGNPIQGRAVLVTANEAGEISGSFGIPAFLAVGERVLTAYGTESGRLAEASFTVVASTPHPYPTLKPEETPKPEVTPKPEQTPKPVRPGLPSTGA